MTATKQQGRETGTGVKPGRGRISSIALVPVSRSARYAQVVSRRLQIHAPAVVLDWNLLRTMPKSFEIPPYYACVVPDHVLHEIATTKSGDPEELIRKFGTWAARNASRLWCGRTKEDLINLQWEQDGRPLSVHDIVHWQRTRQLRDYVTQPSPDWGNFVETAQGGPSINYRAEDIKRDAMICDLIAKRWQSTYGGRQLPPAELAKWIRGPELITPFVRKLYARRWRQPWTGTLVSSPNRFALTRWARFVAWYCMQRIMGNTKNFENNFDDAVYGVLASYTGHLGTNDRGLKEAAEAIFPGIRFLDKNGLIAASVCGSTERDGKIAGDGRRGKSTGTAPGFIR